jgi:DNA-binding response OmpR family regulator
MKILLAEDDPHICVIAKIALEKLGGFDVTIVNDGGSALQTALGGDFDILLLDEMMPVMSGVKVCQEYRAQSPNPSPVIFLSAKSQESDVAEFQSLGDGFIPKPFNPTTLPQTVLSILEKERAA